MSHRLTIDIDCGEPRFRLVCTDAPDADCRMRPSDARECWKRDDPDVTPGHGCVFVEYHTEFGPESFYWKTGWPTIPVAVEFHLGDPVIAWDKPTDASAATTTDPTPKEDDR